MTTSLFRLFDNDAHYQPNPLQGLALSKTRVCTSHSQHTTLSSMASNVQQTLPLSPETIGAAVVGAVTFPVVLAGSQVAVFKPLGLTYSQSSRLSSLFGGLTVCAAGFTASLLTAKTFAILQSALPRPDNPTPSLAPITARDILLSSISSAVVFRALGGRFGSVLPSHLLRPGAFAREWLPASRGVQYASDKEREMVQTMGRKYGCHSCGRRRVSSFVSDHQPPTKSIAQSETGELLSQRFYPQCNRCSQQQGGVLNSNSNGGLSPKAIRTHSFSLRPYHVFMPLPFLFTYLHGGGDKEQVNVNAAIEVKEVVTQTVSTQLEPPKRTLHKLIHESDINELVLNFPLLIVWQKLVGFLDSFQNAGDSFHITLWSFLIIAAWGTI